MAEFNVEKQMAEIQAAYDDTTENFSALVQGEPGVGKTRFIGTGRLPILIDSFDPKGTIILRRVYGDLMDKGLLLVRTFWNESYKDPKMYTKWEGLWERDIANKFFDNFGTYGIDSLSTFIDAMANEVSDEKGRKEGTLAIQDYIPLYNNLKDIVKITASQDCDFILTGHLEPVKNEVTGGVKSELAVFGKLKVQIPLLFTEKYVLTTKPSSDGTKYILLTQSTHRHTASTQLGAEGVFKREEEPNIKNLLKKAGLPTTDKTIKGE